MIKLTKLDGSEMYINPDLIEIMEETPDTHITLMNGNRYLVLEKARAIVDRIVVFRARIIHRAEICQKQKYLKKQRRESYLKGNKQEIAE
ncbi:MAG: flagellar FlbD family protein [Desulfobacteraceae bacterium]|nr:flagellar FlbD family protein [Desulfobacteraceae bacterium]